MAVPKKAVIIGFDAPIVKSVWRCAKEGRMPNIAKLIEEGVWAENCLVPHPTITPPNWTTIVTGAWPGTHGITCFHIHKQGMELDFGSTYQAFSSEDVQAEYIWEALERAGKKSIVINYPTTWPPRMKDGVQLAGYGLQIPDRRWSSDGKPLPGWDSLISIAGDQLITNTEIPLATIVRFVEASGWKGVPDAKRSLECEVKIAISHNFKKIKHKPYYILLQDTDGNGFRELSLSRSKNAKDILFTIKEGQWSKRIYEKFDTEQGEAEGMFMAKFINISPDASEFRLYITPIVETTGWSYPENVAKDLRDINGFPSHIEISPYMLGWIDEKTYLETADMEAEWLGEAAANLMGKTDWTLLAMHAHFPDHAYHAYFNKYDPTKNSGELKICMSGEDSFYAGLDRMVGKIVEAAGEDALIIITSDHGAVPTEDRTAKDFKHFDVGSLLVQAGLTVLKDDPSNPGKKITDWTKTKTVAQRSVYVYVNLKGRDPRGIVEPGEEYEKLCDQIINLLYDYTDPKTGRKPIAFAFKKEDARILGLYGDRIGDIVYGVHGWVSGEHGRQITTADYGMGSIKGLLIMKGPNIKKNLILQRTVWITDIVPTICYILNLPIPRTVDGAVIYQAMEDPDFQTKEIEKLRQNYERVKSALEGQKALTHSYGE